MVKMRFFFNAVFLISLGISCQQQHAKWEGTIENINGLIIVKNPRKPIYEPNIISLTQELSIGQSEETGNSPILQNIPNNGSVDIDKDGKIYVLDWKARQILVFNGEGKYLRRIGKKGQGPGEFQAVGAIKVLPTNQLAVYDSTLGRLSIFYLDGTLINIISNLPRLLATVIDADGNLVGTTLVMMETHNVYELVKVFVGQNRTVNIGKVRAKLPLVGSNLYVFAHMIFFDVQTDNRIVWGSQESYRLDIVDKEGNITKRIIKEYAPITISDEDRFKQAGELLKATSINPASLKIESPKFRGAFSVIRSDERGLIYVLTPEKDQKQRSYLDVFDAEGKYLTRIALRSTPILIRNNKIFSTEESEEGYLVLERYRINWPKHMN